jgi:hypothetical protein
MFFASVTLFCLPATAYKQSANCQNSNMKTKGSRGQIGNCKPLGCSSLRANKKKQLLKLHHKNLPTNSLRVWNSNAATQIRNNVPSSDARLRQFLKGDISHYEGYDAETNF